MLLAFAELRDVHACGKGIEIPFRDADGTALSSGVGGWCMISGEAASNTVFFSAHIIRESQQGY